MRRAVHQSLARVPRVAWLALAGYLVGPWLIRYWVWALGGCVDFFFPAR